MQVTGPTEAFSTEFYIYIEASSPRRLNDDARWVEQRRARHGRAGWDSRGSWGKG